MMINFNDCDKMGKMSKVEIDFIIYPTIYNLPHYLPLWNSFVDKLTLEEYH